MDDLDRYVEAYEALYGCPPLIEWRGAWLSIGGGTFGHKVRRGQLPAMTANLKYLASLKAGNCGDESHTKEPSE